MLYHSFKPKPSHDNWLATSRLIFRDLEANHESFNQQNETINEERNQDALGEMVNKINTLDLAGQNGDPIELPRNKNIYEVLVQSLAEANIEPAAGMAAEIADGLAEHSNFGTERAISPWRHFDSFKIVDGQLTLYRENRRGEIQANSNINLSEARSSFMLEALEQRDDEVSAAIANTSRATTDVTAEIATDAPTASATAPQSAEAPSQAPQTQPTRDRVRTPRAARRAAPRRTPARSVETVTPRTAPTTVTESSNRDETSTEVLTADLINAIDNINRYNSLNLVPDLQRNYTLNQFRSMATNGRISRFEQISRDLDQIGISFNELSSMLHYRNTRGDARSQEAGNHINTSTLLAHTPFADENIEEFFRRTLLLEQIENKTPEEENTLQQRRNIFLILNRLVNNLENMELSDEHEPINPDYIRRVRIDRDVDRQIREAFGHRSFEGFEKELVAVVSSLYGPFENLVERGVFSIENRGNTNQRENMYVLNWNNLEGIDLSRIERVFTQMDRRESSNSYSRLYGRHRTLTDAMGDIQESHVYNVIRRDRFENPSFNLDNISENDLVVLKHLNYMFNINDSGPRFAHGRRSLEMSDTIGGASERTLRQAGTDQYISDRECFNYLAPRLLERDSSGIDRFSPERLATEINRLAEAGKRRAMLDPTLDARTRERLSNYNFVITADVLESGNVLMPEDTITLVRYGILETSDRGRIENMNEIVDTQTQMEAGITEQFRVMGVPPQDAERLARESMGLLGAIDINEILTSHRISAGANIRIRLGARKDETGTYQLITGDGGTYDLEEPFQEANHTVLTVGIGSSQNIERIGQRPDDIGLEIGVATQVSENFRFGTSITVRPFSGISTGAQGQVELVRRNWSMDFGAGVGTTFLGVPYGHARLGFGQGIEQRINNAVDRTSENMDLNRIEPSVWRAIDAGQLDQTQILEIARSIPAIGEAVNNSDLPADRKEEANVYYLETIANSIVNEGLENTRGVGFHFGVMLLVTPAGPIPTPFVDIEFVTRRVRYSSVRESDFEALEMSSEQALSEIQAQLSQSNNTESIVTFNGLESRLDPLTGQQTLTQSVTGGPNRQGIRFENAADFVTAMNERSIAKGIEFSNVDVAETGFTFAFSLNDYSRNNFYQMGISRATDILVDPTTGFHIERIDNNLYGIRFGSNPNALPPNDMNIIRQDVTRPHGRRNNLWSVISFSAGDNAKTGEQLANDPLVEQMIHINERGEYSEINLRGEHSTQIEWAEREGRLPEITPEQLEQLANGNADLLAFVTNLDSSQTSSAERIAELETFYTQISGDQEFLSQFAQATTLDVEHGSRPDQLEVVTLLQTKWNEINGDTKMPEFTQADILDLESRLIPDTFIKLREIRENRRVDEVKRVINEITQDYVQQLLQDDRYSLNYIENGNRVEFTSNEQTEIINTISQLATSKADELADAITNGQREQLSIDTVDGVLTTAALRRMGAHGFRQHLFAEGHMPEIIEGSQTSFFDSESTNPETQLLVAQFVSNLYEPAINFEGNFETEIGEVQELFQSPSALELIGLTTTIDGSDRILSAVSLMYTPEQFARFNELYQQISNGESPTLTDSDREILNHFINTVQEIRETRQSEVKITNIDGETKLTLTIDSDAGFMFIAECGNLTLYYNKQFGATFTNAEQYQLQIGSGETVQQRDYSVEAKTMRLGIAAPVRGRIRRDNDYGKEDDDDTPEEIDDGKEDREDAPMTL